MSKSMVFLSLHSPLMHSYTISTANFVEKFVAHATLHLKSWCLRKPWTRTNCINRSTDKLLPQSNNKKKHTTSNKTINCLISIRTINILIEINWEPIHTMFARDSNTFASLISKSILKSNRQFVFGVSKNKKLKWI